MYGAARPTVLDASWFRRARAHGTLCILYTGALGTRSWRSLLTRGVTAPSIRPAAKEFPTAGAAACLRRPLRPHRTAPHRTAVDAMIRPVTLAPAGAAQPSPDTVLKRSTVRAPPTALLPPRTLSPQSGTCPLRCALHSMLTCMLHHGPRPTYRAAALDCLEVPACWAGRGQNVGRPRGGRAWGLVPDRSLGCAAPPRGRAVLAVDGRLGLAGRDGGAFSAAHSLYDNRFTTLLKIRTGL